MTGSDLNGNGRRIGKAVRLAVETNGVPPRFLEQILVSQIKCFCDRRCGSWPHVKPIRRYLAIKTNIWQALSVRACYLKTVKRGHAPTRHSSLCGLVGNSHRNFDRITKPHALF